MMNKILDLDPIVLDDIDPTSEWVEETEDPKFDVDFDIDMELGGCSKFGSAIRTGINTCIKQMKTTNGRH